MVKYTEHIHWGWWWLELGELVCPSCCNKRLVCTCNVLLQNGSLEELKNGRIAGWEHLWWKNGMAFFSFRTFSASVPSLHFGSSDQVIKLARQNISVTNASPKTSTELLKGAWGLHFNWYNAAGFPSSPSLKLKETADSYWNSVHLCTHTHTHCENDLRHFISLHGLEIVYELYDWSKENLVKGRSS